MSSNFSAFCLPNAVPMQQNHSVSGSEISGCSQPYPGPPVDLRKAANGQSERMAAFGTAHFARERRGWAQTRPVGFVRHSTPQPSHLLEGLYISWRLRPDQLYRFREEKEIEQPRTGDEGIDRAAAKITAETTLSPQIAPYSHSMVPGGFEVTSYTTRLTPFTSFTIRVAMWPSKSSGKR